MAWEFFNEVSRKIVHFLILFVLLGYVVMERQYSKQIALLAIIALLLLFLAFEYLRLELGFKMQLFQFLIRPKERYRPTAGVYFLTAAIISLAVFDFPIALAALLMTTFGDMAAALIGKKYGQTLIFRNKTMVGSITELIVNLIVGFLVLKNIYVLIAMAFTATLAEALVDELDDNLVVPLAAGFIGQLFLLLI